MYNADRQLIGVEAVIDKAYASGLLARELKADLFIMVTDVNGMVCCEPRKERDR